MMMTTPLMPMLAFFLFAVGTTRHHGCGECQNTLGLPNPRRHFLDRMPFGGSFVNGRELLSHGQGCAGGKVGIAGDPVNPNAAAIGGFLEPHTRGLSGSRLVDGGGNDGKGG